MTRFSGFIRPVRPAAFGVARRRGAPGAHTLSFAARNLIRLCLALGDGLLGLGERLRRAAERMALRRSAGFDPAWYLAVNADVRQSGVDPVAHFLAFGVAERRQPSADFPLSELHPRPGPDGRALNPVVWLALYGDGGLGVRRRVALTRRSTMFDADWYRATYPDVARAHLDPAAHYAEFGWIEHRNPGPRFNTRHYLDQMETDGFPLEHYESVGKAAGLSPAPAAVEPAPTLPTGPLRLGTALERRFRVGVAVHVFYVEMGPDIAAAVARLPVDFDLLVSTDTAEKAAALDGVFAGLSQVRRCAIRVVPNRGRDVAPMLTAFAADIAACDLVLHLHSKRSPYGARLHGWFEHCVDHLAHSPLYIEMILRAFDADPRLGVLHAPAFAPIMTHMTWSGMREDAQALLARMGLDPDLTEAFPLVFPASTMMWFRPAALAQVFDTPWTPEDFPEEAGQTDGTLAHMVERLIFYVAHANGYGWRTARPAAPGEGFALRLIPPPEAPLALPVCADPMVSIVIPVFNQWETTAACLRSIIEHTDPVATPYEVILGDDASTDATRDAAARFANLRVVRAEANRGFLLNANAAAEAARGRWIMLLNNDTQVQPGWLDALLDGFRLRPDAAVVGAKLLYPDGTLQEAGGVIWRDGGGMNYGRNATEPLRADFSYFHEVDYVSGAAILVDGAFWRARGGFDVRFTPAYYEDTDLCFAARAAGRRVYLHPGALVAHFEGKSHGTDIGAGVKRHQEINRGVFVEKWAEVLARDHADGGRLWRARDRALDRRVVVVIDWEAPEYDRHAGGRYVFDYLRLLVDAGHAVKFLACHLGNERQLGVAAELRRLGVEVHLPPRFAEAWNWSAWIADHAADIDVVILSRPGVAENHQDMCEGRGVPNVYLCHDVHSLRLLREAEQTASPALRAGVEAAAAYEGRAFRRADFSFTPSAYEIGHIREAFGVDAVGLLPVYVLRSPPTPRAQAPAGMEVLFVGGMEHGPNPDGVGWFLVEIWPLLRAARPGAQLHVVGRNAPDALLALATEGVTFHGGVSEAELAARYESARVVIAPLRFGAGVKGKVVEAMRFGVPLVGTSVALEGFDAAPGTFSPADDPAAFAQATAALLDCDAQTWRACSARLQAEVWRLFNAERCAALLHAGLEAAWRTRGRNALPAPDRP